MLGSVVTFISQLIGHIFLTIILQHLYENAKGCDVDRKAIMQASSAHIILK